MKGKKTRTREIVETVFNTDYLDKLHTPSQRQTIREQLKIKGALKK